MTVRADGAALTGRPALHSAAPARSVRVDDGHHGRVQRRNHRSYNETIHIPGK